MNILYWIILMTSVEGLVGLVGVFALLLKEKILNRILLVLVAFSAGALLGGAFFHLLVESLESLNAINVFSYTIIGFILFFLIEKFLHLHNYSKEKFKVHPFTYLILYGDAIHNFIDGLVIAASFIISIPFGVVTSLMIIAHEVPQEAGDFGVLVYGGFKKSKALFFNFLAQLTAVLGGIIGFLISSAMEFVIFLLPFAAGGFLYIAASDLIPELQKEKGIKKSLCYIVFFIIGIALLLLIKLLIVG